MANLARIMDLTRLSHPEDLGDDSLPMLAVGLNWSEPHIQLADPGSEWKPQYFVPRYIADCARRVGFRGILFDSSRHFGTNLVLFEWGERDIRPIGEPEILRVSWSDLSLEEDKF